ncbi:MAG: hypothetical protein GXO26_05370 [Crenarchaeota archaeon]|nr:hypothetical protein [Thermoproteota archaeon]
MSKRSINIALCILVAILWGILGLFIKLLDPLISPSYQVSVRYLVSLISYILIMLITWTRGVGHVGAYYITHVSYLRIGRIALSNIIVIILAAVVGFGISIPAFFLAVAYCGVYFTYIVGIGLTVIVTALLKVVTGSEMFTKYKLGYVTLLIIIIIITIIISKILTIGLTYVILFAVTWGAYLWLVGNINRPFKTFLEKLYSTCIDMSISLLVGLISLTLFFHLNYSNILKYVILSFTSPYVFILMIVGIVLLCTVLPYIIICIVLSMDPTLVVNFSIIQYLEVILALMLGVFYFHELPLDLTTMMYMTFAVIGLVVCMVLRMREVSVSK